MLIPYKKMTERKNKSERRTRYTYDDDDRTAVVDGEVVDGGTSGKPWLWRLEDDDWFDWFAKPAVELNVRQVAIMAGVSDVDSVTTVLASIYFMNDVELLYIEYYSNSGDEWAETRGIALTDEDMRNALRTMFDGAISDEDQAKLLAIAPTLVKQLAYTFPKGTVVGGTSMYSNERDRYPRDFVWKPEQVVSEANKKTLRAYFCIEGTGDDTAELAVFVDERDDRDGNKLQAYSSEEEHVSAYIDYIEDECVPMRNPEDSIVYAMLSRVYDDYDIVIVDKDSLQERGKPRKTNNKRGESAKKFRSTQKRGKKSEGAAREYTNRIDSLVAMDYLTMEDVAEFLLRAFSEDDIRQAYGWMEQDELIPSESQLADDGVKFNDDGDLVSIDSDESYRRARRANRRIR